MARKYTPARAAANKRWAEANAGRMRELKAQAAVRQRRKLKRMVVDAYGGGCACCGESELDFLTVDHIGGLTDEDRDSSQRHGRKLWSDRLYRWLRDNDYPDRFRVLCWNCNSAIGAFGTCPHQR